MSIDGFAVSPFLQLNGICNVETVLDDPKLFISVRGTRGNVVVLVGVGFGNSLLAPRD